MSAGDSPLRTPCFMRLRQAYRPVSNPQYPDIVVGNKKGVFVFKHETKKVSQSEWEKAQPKPVADAK